MNQYSGGDGLIVVVMVMMVIVEVILRGEGDCGEEVLGQVFIVC